MVNVRIVNDDCVEAMRRMPENLVDAVVTDPPYGLSFMDKDFDKLGKPGTMQAWHEAWACEAFRVLKPGAFAVVAGGTRTFHRLVCALEDAGFEIRDTIMHCHGSGFPKSKSMKDIGKPELGTALKPAFEPWTLCRKPLSESGVARNVLRHGTGALNVDASRIGSGEKIVSHRGTGNGVAMQGNIAENGRAKPYRKGDANEHNVQTKGRWPSNLLLSHPSGCVRTGVKRVQKGGGSGDGSKWKGTGIFGNGAQPSRLSHYDPDGTEEVEAWECVEGCPVRALDEQSGVSKSGGTPPRRKGMGYRGGANGNGSTNGVDRTEGGASRFFKTFEPDTGDGFLYVSKASRAERERGLEGVANDKPDAHNLSSNACGRCGLRVKANGSGKKCGCGDLRETVKLAAGGNTHPTVKPLALMRYLVRMITPPTTLRCEKCYNIGNDAHAENLPGVRPNVSAEAEGANILLSALPGEGERQEAPHDTSTQGLRNVRQDVQAEGCTEPLLLQHVQGGRAEEASSNMRTVRDTIPPQAEKGQTSEVLLSGMRGGSPEDDTAPSVRMVRKGVDAQEGRREALLLPEMCDQVDGQEEGQGVRNGPEGLQASLSAGASQGEQAGLHNRAPGDNGGNARASSRQERGSASQERHQGRQQAGEFRSDASPQTQQPLKAAAEADTVPPLRQNDSRFGACSTCGSTLVERPGLVLDPFCGSGSTLCACALEGFDAIGIEREEEYAAIAERRVAYHRRQMSERLFA